MEIKAIIGLGNPGEKYKNTYHNVGHLFIDYLTRTIDKDIALIKPETFMNESGISVRAIVKKGGWKPNQIVIVHDESDITLGKFKLSFGRSSAGHKGVQSIIDMLGTQEFYRLRIGIRKKPGKALDFVLKKISAADRKILDKVFKDSLASLETIFEI